MRVGCKPTKGPYKNITGLCAPSDRYSLSHEVAGLARGTPANKNSVTRKNNK